MTVNRTFHLPVAGEPAQVEALISYTAYEIQSVTRDGSPVEMSLDDLEAFERHVDSQIQRAEVFAHCFDTGQTEVFTVITHRRSVLAVINNRSGFSYPHSSPQFTEVAESWHIDTEAAEAVESDQPHAAVIAGYIHPQPSPNSQGHGYRRAA